MYVCFYGVYICISFRMRGFLCLNVDRISSPMILAKILKKRSLIMYSLEKTNGNGVQSTCKEMILYSA